MDCLPNFIETCKAMLGSVIEEINAENCSLMMTEPDSGELSIVVARGKNDGESTCYPFPSSIGKRFKPGEGIAGWVLKAGRSMMVNNTKEAPLFIHFNGTNGYNKKINSIICFPIRENDQVVGVFNLSHSQPGVFGEWEKMAMAYIANQIGVALTISRFILDNRDNANGFPRKSTCVEKANNAQPSCSSILIEDSDLNNKSNTNGNGKFIFASNQMVRIKEIIEQVANTDITVLIQGESGVGKEVVARSIYVNSSRRDQPFVKVNCAALPSELLESELFGHEKGAFTGAYRQKPGKFELANNGIVFLDEIAEIKPALQAKLLQVLQDCEFSRLGGKKDVKVDVRVIAATNRNLEEAVAQGQFREDFYYRLNIVNIVIPPLRERKEEIPVFVEYFLDKFGKKYSRKVKKLSNEMMRAFLQYNWPGNIRELENVIQRFIVLGEEKTIIEDLAALNNKNTLLTTQNPTHHQTKIAWPSLKEVNRGATVKAESEVIRKVLEQTYWNRKRAAELLNISYKTLLYKIKDLEHYGQAIPLSK